MLRTRESRLRRWVLVDVLMALTALVTELPWSWSQGPAIVVGELLVASAIATRRLAAFPAAVTYDVVLTVQAVVSADPPEGQLSLIGAVALSYTFGTMRGWLRSVAGLLLVAAGGCAHEVFAGSDYTFVVGLAVVGWLPGVAVRYRSQEVATLRKEADSLQREQSLREEAAAAAERNRLARELHDVVSHSVSAMVIQAAAAEQVLGQDPQEARRALGRVQQTGRDAIAELHRLLGVLRPDEEQTALAPAPGVYAIAGLVEESRADGHDVRLEVIGETNGLPTALQLSAYRIVQESLTNARKYAPESPVWVRLDAGAGGLEIDVVDSGGGHAPSSGGGRGLRGLQERAAAFGGTVEAGSSGTGFAVRARLPLGTAP